MQNKAEAKVVEFLKEELTRIEDILFELGEIEEVRQSDDTTNNIIQEAFRFVELQLEHGDYINALEELKLRKWSTRKWV